MMTRKEVDKKRQFEALELLSRSGVGYIHGVNTLGTENVDKIYDLGLAGSEAEAIVKIALQFAFSNRGDFIQFVNEQTEMEPHKRFYRVRR